MCKRRPGTTDAQKKPNAKQLNYFMFHISDEIWERGERMTIMMSMLTRIEPENNMDRWYFVGIQSTLLEPWAVI